MRNLIYILAALIVISCGDESAEVGTVTIKGNIEGLKVGNVLLQKVADTSLITLDSVALDGSSEFKLSGALEEPELMYLHLDVKDGAKYDDRIAFFAEDTVLTFSSTLEDFEKDYTLEGSENHNILMEFNVNKKRLDELYTELVKRSIALDNQESPVDPAELDKLDEDYNKYLRKRVLYAINFAQRFKDKEVAPYLLVSEAFDANPILLDSAYQKMPKKIQTSRYGKQLSELIKSSKENL
ncbi:hypothetical protein BST97_00515 [Nonlabens spongiae]|uniref:DUF4369 domain-containing protein n=1 Tax=Nonlabens spongiae TaxID=331648 RepID=A0A1W6MGA5_9FLAO|nr:DUF4369 domain-containing protein [Nonlabens spongiae]ARN76607.1 hypothetical protein BST97_00515 [Nonlabens spongiae]